MTDSATTSERFSGSLSIQGGATERRDPWWIEPAITFTILSVFGMYATWAAFQNANYEWGAYLSPFYSPNLPAWFPEQFGWWTFSPALLILPFPLLFRATCYYYRKAYYRAFFTSPVACAVDAPVKSPLALLLGQGRDYIGETLFPVVLQNFHRFAFYAAAVFIAILAYDAYEGFFGWEDGFHVGVGSLVLLVNVVLLGLYTFSCHSWRHLLGGCMDCFAACSVSKIRHKAWENQSKINEHHMEFAWASLFSVGLADLYVRLCAMGVIHDIRLF